MSRERGPKATADKRRRPENSPWRRGPACPTKRALASFNAYTKRGKATQPDLYRDSPQALARAERLAAESARINPYETPEAAERRALRHEAEAERLERLANQETAP